MDNDFPERMGIVSGNLFFLNCYFLNVDISLTMHLEKNVTKVDKHLTDIKQEFKTKFLPH